MSNTRRPRWSRAQIDAANAEQLLGELADAVAGAPSLAPRIAQLWDALDAEGRAEELPALMGEFHVKWAGRFREMVVRDMAADLAARGVSPGLIAEVERAAMDLGDDWWAARYHELMQRSS